MSEASSGGTATARPRDLPALLRFQREACAAVGSNVYVQVLDRTIERVDRPGPIRDLLAPHAEDAFGSALALRFLGAVHRVALEGRAPGLAAQFPSTGGAPGPGLGDAFEDAVAANAGEIEQLIRLGVQTNEVGRSATLVGALLEVARLGLPLRVFEMGASAGLNLRWDAYRYEAGPDGVGPADSPVRFVDPWVDRHPRLDVPATAEVLERRGCDLSPIDATTEAGRTVLRSYVWPDLVERFARLDAAISVARAMPVAIDAADAAKWTAERLAEPVPGTTTVLMHSIVVQYMSAEGRSDLVRTVKAAGARATTAAPFAWIRLEPGREGAELRSSIWPGGAERLLAVSTYHGPPVRWVGAGR